MLKLFSVFSSEIYLNLHLIYINVNVRHILNGTEIIYIYIHARSLRVNSLGWRGTDWPERLVIFREQLSRVRGSTYIYNILMGI